MSKLRTGCCFALLALLIGCDSATEGDLDLEFTTGPEVDLNLDSQPTEPPPKSDFADVDEALATLVTAIEAKESPQQVAALNWIGAQGEAAVPALVAAVEDEAAGITYRRVLMQTLTRYGEAATPVLLKASTDGELAVQLKAVECLGAVDPPTPKILDRLIELIDDDHSQVRRFALRAIGKIGPRAERAAPRLKEIRKDPKADEAVRVAAGEALKAVKPIATFKD